MSEIDNELLMRYVKDACEQYDKALENRGIMQEHTAGSSIDAWDATHLPPEEWAMEIFEDAQKTATFLPTIVRRYDSPRKVTVPIQTITSSSWVSTISADVTDATAEGSTHYDATGTVLDPVDYRTYTPIGVKSIEEATWGVAADVRNRLVNAVALKLDTLAWESLHATALSSGKYIVGGETLNNTYTSNAVDYGTALTIDNVIDLIYNIRNTSYNFFKPTDAQFTASVVKELIKSSTFTSSAEYGNRGFLETGEFVTFLGLNWMLSGNIPQDSGSTDIGLVYDRRYFMIANIPHEFQLETEKYRPKDEIRFFAKCKADFKTGDPEAGAVAYS